MHSRMWTVGALVTMAAITGLLLPRPPVTAQDKDKPPAVKWEYKVVPQEKLAALGDQGWEVFAVTGGQPYIESSRFTFAQGAPMLIPAGRAIGPGDGIQNTVKFAPTLYHLKRQK